MYSYFVEYVEQYFTVGNNTHGSTYSTVEYTKENKMTMIG